MYELYYFYSWYLSGFKIVTIVVRHFYKIKTIFFNKFINRSAVIGRIGAIVLIHYGP